MARIAISGLSGCGATTATSLVAGKLGVPQYNFTLRDLAKEKAMTLEKIQAVALQDDSVDLEVDGRQAQFALKNHSWVIGSRLALWLDDLRFVSRTGIKKRPEIGLKVWLDAGLEERARRIAKREGMDASSILADVEKRDAENKSRYLRLYGIDTSVLPKDAKVINTGKLGAKEVADEIIALLEREMKE